METMQITLVQALAPEAKAPEAERSNEFSSILSGQEVVSQAESPPGLPAPPGNKPAVEEAEIQEPNAQSQEPDFHCKNDAQTGSQDSNSDLEGCTDSQTAATDHSEAEDLEDTSAPQLIAQTALAWINLVPETQIQVPEPAAIAEQPLQVEATSSVGATVKTDTLVEALMPESGAAPTLTSLLTEEAPATPVAANGDQAAKAALTIDALDTKGKLVASPSAQPGPAATAAPSSDSVAISELSVQTNDPDFVTIITVDPKSLDINGQNATQSQPIANARVATALEAQPILAEQVEVQIGVSQPELASEQTATIQPVDEQTDSMVLGTTEQKVAPAPVAAPQSAAKETSVASASASKQAETVVSATQNATQNIVPPTSDAPKAKATAKGQVETKAVSEGKESTEATGVEGAVKIDKPTAPSKQSASQNDQSGLNKQSEDSQLISSGSGKEESTAAQTAVTDTQNVKSVSSAKADSAKVVVDKAPLSDAKTTEVIRQVVDRVETIAATHRPGGIVVRLDPQDLGTITMTVKSIGDQIEAHIVASDDRVRTALDTTRNQLAQAIEAKGFSLKSVTVNETTSTQSQSDSTSYQNNQSQQQSQHDQQSMRQQANLWNYAYSNKSETAMSIGFRQAKQTGLDLWL